MIKYIRLIATWALGCVLLSLWMVSATLTVADPIDDFSMTLRKSTDFGVYRLISKHEVIGILNDKLDYFPSSQVPRLAQHLMTLCEQYRFDPALILSLIEVESHFQLRAVSSVGAVGLMQVMPATAGFVIEDLELNFSGFESLEFRNGSQDFSTPALLMDPFANIAIGMAYLAWLRDHYQSVSPYVLAAYNLGPGRMDTLLSRKSFQPQGTKAYFQAIRRNMPSFRFYKASKIKFKFSSRKIGI